MLRAELDTGWESAFPGPIHTVLHGQPRRYIGRLQMIARVHPRRRSVPDLPRPSSDQTSPTIIAACHAKVTPWGRAGARPRLRG